MSELFSNIFIAREVWAYTLTEKIGTLTEVKPGGESAYFEQLFYFLLGVAAVLAVLKIVMGGIKYIYSSMSPPALEEAKADINAAIFGLILALSSYLILFTINPNLLKLDFTVTAIPAPVIATPPPSTPNPNKDYISDKSYYNKNPGLKSKDMTGNNWTTEEKEKLLTGAEATKDLKDAGIAINRGYMPVSQNCGTDCTSLNGMPKTTINTLVEAKKNCPTCEITVTGGTESGHQQQGFGKASIDLRYDENTYKYLAARQDKDNTQIVREAQTGDPVCGTAGWSCYDHVTARHMSLYNKTGGLNGIK